MYPVLRHAVVRFEVSGTVRDWQCRLCGTGNPDGDGNCGNCGGRRP
jgi:hypothetical protein